MNKLKLTLTASLIAASSLGYAQSDSSGFYGLAQFGTTEAKDTISDTSGGLGDSDTQGNGWMLGLGYDFNDNFAVEGSYGQFYKSVGSNNLKNTTTTDIYSKSVDADGFLFSALAKTKVSENIKVFAGPTLMVFKVKSNSSVYYKNGNANPYSDTGGTSFTKNIPGLTLGVSFALDKRTDLRLSYNTFAEIDMPSDSAGVTDKAKLSTTLVGLAIKF